ncbi:OsmC family protein [Actinomycetospora sp. OC33-EN08]|uniref:OsmC family protein n=1 Tax=Actinomycetospora aurantiaca TaxID=3129233 RepID=A0ABU8MTF5_9PSEU
MSLEHEYRLAVTWADDPGTVDYRSYTRDHVVTAGGKPALEGSADRAFRGDAARWNPEELLVAALSECHLLSFLHVAAEAGLVVTEYADAPVGRMTKDDDGGWSFESVVLHPTVTATGDADLAALHHAAHEACFIARSVAFPVTVEAAQ